MNTEMSCVPFSSRWTWNLRDLSNSLFGRCLSTWYAEIKMKLATLASSLGLLFLCVTACAQDYRKQTASITEACQRIGPCGQSLLLTLTPEGVQVRAELNFKDRKYATDEALVHLQGLHGIVGINLCNTPITDEGLKILATLPDLEYLQLADTVITDEGIVELRAATKLSRIDIRRTKITNNVAKILGKFPSLSTVHAKGTPLTESEDDSFKVLLDDQPCYEEEADR